MSLKRGFDATASISVNGTAKEIKTRGDITFEESYSEVEIKNAASEEVRYLRGMKSTTFQMTVQAGTDPEDSDAFDAYSALKTRYDSGEAFSMTFTSPGGLSRTKNFIITAWSDANPIDGVNEATITFKRSAVDEGSGSGSGSGSGNGAS